MSTPGLAVVIIIMNSYHLQTHAEFHFAIHSQARTEKRALLPLINY